MLFTHVAYLGNTLLQGVVNAHVLYGFCISFKNDVFAGAGSLVLVSGRGHCRSIVLPLCSYALLKVFATSRFQKQNASLHRSLF